MKTIKAISKAKRESYIRLINSGELKTKTIKVLAYIKKWQKCKYNDEAYTSICSTYALRNDLNMPHQTITGIISNLLDIGIIKIVAEEKVGKNVYSIYEYVEDVNEQIVLENIRRITKYAYYVKQGIREYADIMGTDLLNQLLDQEKWANDYLNS